MKSLCIFCGARLGNSEAFRLLAQAVGSALAENKIQLVYGGGSVGLMGAVADASLQKGGRVIGVIPKNLFSKEVAHEGLSELHLVESMHARKAMMCDLADGFLILPGGFGTFDEFFEILTWAQIGIHEKPIGILNVDSFYDLLFQFMQKTRDAGFVNQQGLDLVHPLASVSDLVRKFIPLLYENSGNSNSGIPN